MEYLRNLGRTHPHVRIIDLSNRQISNLEILLPLLSQFSELEELNLEGNNLRHLPSLHSIPKITNLNLAENGFTNLTQVVKALSTLEGLKSLHINLETVKDAQFVLDQLPGLKFLNGQKIYEEDQKAPVEEGELESAAELVAEELSVFHSIANFRSTSEPLQKTRMSEQLQKQLTILQAQITEHGRQRQVGSVEYESQKIQGRKQLLQLCFQNMIEIQPNEEIAWIWQQIQLRYDDIIDSLTEKILIPQMSKFNFYEKECERLKYQLQGEMEKSQKLQIELQDALNLLNSIRIEKEKSLTERQPIFAETLEEPVLQYNPAPEQAYSSSSSTKALTLKQLREIIQDIYETKQEYDTACKNSGQSLESMEQYLYIYLHDRYGSKQLIIDQTQSILEGLEAYSEVDIDVEVFMKILKSEIGEDFRFYIARAKEKILDSLKEVIESTSPSDRKARAFEEALQSQINSTIWRNTLRKLFKEPEATRLADHISREYSEIMANTGSLDFVSFQKAILEHELLKYEENLRRKASLSTGSKPRSSDIRQSAYNQFLDNASKLQIV